MIAAATQGAAIAALTWPSGNGPLEVALIGLPLFVAGVLGAAALSNRMQRGIRAVAAGAFYRLWFGRREARLRQRVSLERIRTLRDLLEQLPDITASAAGVDPVTLYLLDHDGDHYVPVSSTLFPTPSTPVGADEPLPKALRKSRRVCYLRSRTDDLQNAPIYAVNGRHLEECRAACALPLCPNGTLAGFLLCGGTDGTPRLGLLSGGYLEGLGQSYAELLRRFPDVHIAVGESLSTDDPAATQQA